MHLEAQVAKEPHVTQIMTASAVAFGEPPPVRTYAPSWNASDQCVKDVAEQLPLHLPALRRYARALTGDVAAADDLAQDCAERALSRAHLWRGWGSLRAWLVTIMHNLHANNQRNAARRPRFASIDNVSDPPCPEAGQLDQLIVNDTLATLGLLSSAHREVLTLVAVEGMSYAEVAKIIGVPSGTVMSRLSRARNRLRQLTGDMTPQVNS